MRADSGFYTHAERRMSAFPSPLLACAVGHTRRCLYWIEETSFAASSGAYARFPVGPLRHLQLSRRCNRERHTSSTACSTISPRAASPPTGAGDRPQPGTWTLCADRDHQEVWPDGSPARRAGCPTGKPTVAPSRFRSCDPPSGQLKRARSASISCCVFPAAPAVVAPKNAPPTPRLPVRAFVIFTPPSCVLTPSGQRWIPIKLVELLGCISRWTFPIGNRHPSSDW